MRLKLDWHSAEKHDWHVSDAGLGKTTLAHTIAKHCGYRAYEINASDDRTGRSLQNKISDAVDTRSALGTRLPNLVIIDEVDGVAGNESLSLHLL